MIESPLHGGDRTFWEEKTGRRDFLDFSASINPMGMPESARRALAACAGEAQCYPDPRCRELRRALAALEEIQEEWILCGNGAAELIHRLVYAVRPKRALLPAPTFSEYARALGQVGCAVGEYALRAGDGFAPGVDFLARIPRQGMVFLCNPNNPTGNLLPPELLEEILDTCARRGTMLAVDECFLDLAEEGEKRSLKRLLERAPQLVILRALTKTFAMPGLRLGYCLCADAVLLRRIRAAGAPWSVSAPAQLCGIAAVGERGYLARSRELITRERERLQRALRELGFVVWEGAANFLLFYTEYKNLAEDLAAKGILLRDCGGFPGLEPGYFRTAVRTKEENSALLEAIKESTACRQY